ncbi:MAG: hypothetical protein A2297_07970 [Elusimicrobia bacterium RIFOXYB2_FULL_48_7]|nr:MAG: hypothetical protein A2297_07970 [Elusimicrobia bacterium RIFOXYB2_FULL_48_7]
MKKINSFKPFLTAFLGFAFVLLFIGASFHSHSIELDEQDCGFCVALSVLHTIISNPAPGIILTLFLTYLFLAAYSVYFNPFLQVHSIRGPPCK